MDVGEEAEVSVRPHLDRFEGIHGQEAHLHPQQTQQTTSTTAERPCGCSNGQPPREASQRRALQLASSAGQKQQRDVATAPQRRACTDVGLGAARMATWVTTPSVPSAPMNSWRRSYPVLSLRRVRRRSRTDPSARTICAGSPPAMCFQPAGRVNTSWERRTEQCTRHSKRAMDDQPGERS